MVRLQIILHQILILLKDWLKQHGKTQKDLKNVLNANSERMSALLEIIKADYSSGGIPKVASMLCSIESKWSQESSHVEERKNYKDPFSQLDLLLEEIEEDCND